VCQSGGDAFKRASGPFFEGDGFGEVLVSSTFEGETIFTAEEVRDGRRNMAID
jgi:hypothetical protein